MPTDIPIELIQAVKRGDQRAFAVLLDQCSDYVYALALKMTADEDDARDIAQESFLKVWKKINSYDEQYRFTTWLYKIVVHTCFDALRKRKRMNSYSAHDKFWEFAAYDDEQQGGRQYDANQLIEFIRLISGRLSPKQHAVFVLHDFEGFSQEEIAQMLGMPRNGVKSNLFYARKAIRRMLAVADNIDKYEL